MQAIDRKRWQHVQILASSLLDSTAIGPLTMRCIPPPRDGHRAQVAIEHPRGPDSRSERDWSLGMNSRTVYLRHADPAGCVRDIAARAERVGLKIHPLRREQPGDRFSQLILGTHNFVRTSSRGAEEVKRRVLEHIAQTTVILGIPSADYPRVAAVVADLDAVIFDGTTVRNSSGDDLLV